MCANWRRRPWKGSRYSSLDNCWNTGIQVQWMPNRFIFWQGPQFWILMWTLLIFKYWLILLKICSVGKTKHGWGLNATVSNKTRTFFYLSISLSLLKILSTVDCIYSFNNYYWMSAVDPVLFYVLGIQQRRMQNACIIKLAFLCKETIYRVPCVGGLKRESHLNRDIKKRRKETYWCFRY